MIQRIQWILLSQIELFYKMNHLYIDKSYSRTMIYDYQYILWNKKELLAGNILLSLNDLKIITNISCRKRIIQFNEYYQLRLI